jgi:hypothetical protein
MEHTTGPAAARQRLLREFAEDVRRRLEQDTSPVGQLTCAHIGRQLDLVASERYADWFGTVGKPLGFDQDVVLAAIAGSDVTRMSLFSETARRNFGTTEERVAALAARNDLRYGRAFPTYTALENLYMHAEGARHYTQDEIIRRATGVLDPAATGRLAREVSESILGHDSFNAGFGQHKLKPLLAAKYQERPDAFDYATSCTPSGFIVQVVDRLEGCEPDTMLRYVSEGVLQRKEHISDAIRTGLIDNASFLREVHDRIVSDCRAMLPAEQVAVFLASPPMQDFVRGLARIPHILALFGEPPAPESDGFFHLRNAGGRMPIDSLEAFRQHFVPAAAALGSL